jgi:glucose/arabinose dehydrogenase
MNTIQFRKVGLSVLALVAGVWSLAAQAPRSPSPRPVALNAQVTTVAEGLEYPWAIEILPDGRLLVSERPGRLRLVSSDGRVSPPLADVPKVFAHGQGGLLDIALDPRYQENRLIYLSYAEGNPGGKAGTAVARGRLTDRGLEDVRVIYRQEPKVEGDKHFGSRLAFGSDGMLFVTQGERFEYMQHAQDLSSLLGKIVRIHPDGSIPKDNPFVGQKGARPEIWSYGHRNVQSAAVEPGSGQLWIVEHGAMGGDELNRIEPGKNYGWPVIAYGVHYSGAKIGEGTAKPGMEQPVYYWEPVIAPSGMAFYTGDAFPEWKGSILVGAMKPRGLVRLKLQNGRVVQEQRYLADLNERIRDVKQAPDGSINLLTDSPKGRILRVQPGSRESRHK